MGQTDLAARLQSEIDSLVGSNKDVFSAVLGICDADGRFYWSGAAGVAYPDKPDAMAIDTPIFVASITKMYTAAVTMMLHERGQLSLGDPISEYLPAAWLEGLHVYKGRDYSDQLRVYHLISQTSGLPDYFEDRPKNGQSVYDQIVSTGDMAWSVEDVVRITKSGLSPRFPPEASDQVNLGKKAHYSDTNYQLLGAVVESAGQKSLAELFSEFIIEPLRLSSTFLYGRRAPATASQRAPANIYYGTSALQLDKAMKSFGPDGGLVSNVEDSLAFLKRFMAGDLFSDPLTLRRMKKWKSIFFPFQYGLGLMRFKLPRILSPFSPTPELLGHSGASGAFLFCSEADQLYIAGTLNQLQDRRRPVGLMLRTIKMVSEALSP